MAEATSACSVEKAPRRPFGKALSLRTNALWTLGGSLAYALGQWGIAVTLARTGGAAAVGIFALATAIAMPVLAVAQLALRQVYIVDEADDRRFSTFLVLRLAAAGAAFFLLIGITGAIGFGRGTWLPLAAIALGRCFESVSDMHYAEMQRQKRQDRIARYMTYRAGLCLVLVATSMIVFKSVAIASLAFAVACGLTMLVVDGGSLFSLSGVDWTHLRAIVKRGSPLGVAQLFVSINSNMPRYVIAQLGTLLLLGQYAALEYFIAAGTYVILAVGQSAAPELAEASRNNDKRRFYQLSAKLIGLNATIGIGGVVLSLLIGHWLILHLYGPAFEPVARFLPSLALAYTISFIASATGYIVTARGIFLSQLPVLIATAATTGLTALVAIGHWSLHGVALGIGLGAAVQLGCFLVVLRGSVRQWRESS